MKAGLIPLLSCAALLVAQDAMAQSKEMRSESCVPAALLHGDDAVVGELRAQLSLLGVSENAQENCPIVNADVSRSEEGILVVLEEPSGRSASIQLSDASIAATWIDSWLQEELGAPLLAIRTAPPIQRESRAPSATAPSTERDDEVAKASVLAASGLHLGLGYESASADNQADWRGLRAEACLRIGPLCLGVLARISETKKGALRQDEFADFAEFSQISASALAKVQVPIAIGRSHLIPHVALGASWLKSSRETMQSDCAPEGDPDCFDAFLDDSADARSTLAPELETGLSLALPLTSAVHLRLGSSISLRPFGQSSRSVAGPTLPLPCELPEDPNCGEPEAILLETMPSEPSRFWRLSIGLQVQL